MKLEKKMRAIRDTAKHHDQSLFTTWFETQSDDIITEPPPLHPDCKLESGDLFLHLHAEGVQLWLRGQGDDDDETTV